MSFATIKPYLDTPMEAVDNNLKELVEHATETYDVAIEAIEALKTEIDEPSFNEPNPPDTIYFGLSGVQRESITAPEKASVMLDTAGLPTVDDITFEATGEVPDWADFDPGIRPDFDGIVKPPSLDTSGKPEKPEVDTTVDLPTLVYDEPVMEQLEAISLPSFPVVTLPTFSGDLPEFTTPPPAPLMAWEEPDYVPELLDDIKPVILEMLGGKGLPAEVERALLERAVEKEETATAKLIDEAFDTWAARGFSMPPGMLVEQVNAAQQEMALKRLTFSRDIMIKNWDLMYENLKFAVQQGLAYEGVLISLFNNMVQRQFEMLRFRVEMEMKLYDAAIAVFNAKVIAFKTSADVFRVELEAEVTKLELYRTELEGAKIRSELNSQKVQTYSVRVQALSARINAYRTEIEAEMSKIEIAKAQIEMYRTEIQAWGETIDAQKTQYEVYNTEINAEASKIQLLNASAQAYSSRIAGYSAGISAEKAKLDAKVSVLGAKLKQYDQKLSSQKMLADTKLAEKKSELDIYGGKIQKYQADLQASDIDSKIDIAHMNATLQNNIALFNARMKQYEVQLSSHFKQVELQRSAIENVAKTSAAIAQGALSAVHVSASMSSGGSASASYNEESKASTGS